MKSEYRKGVSEKPLAADCCSGHSRQQLRPTLGALDEHFFDHTRATFTVHGMTCGGCASCAHNIERTVGKLPGIGEVYVNFAAEQAVISFDSEQLDIQNLVDGIEGR